MPGGGVEPKPVFGIRNLLILKSAESLKSPKATSSGTKWAQINEFSFDPVSLHLILPGFQTKFGRGFADFYRRWANPSVYVACARLPRGFGAYYGPSGPVIPLEVGRSFRCDVGHEWVVMWAAFLVSPSSWPTRRNRGPHGIE